MALGGDHNKVFPTVQIVYYCSSQKPLSKDFEYIILMGFFYLKIPWSINTFVTMCQYTDTLFQLEIAALSIQIHDLMDDVLTYLHSVNSLTHRLSGHLVLKVCGASSLFQL